MKVDSVVDHVFDIHLIGDKKEDITSEARDDGTLLDSRRFLKTISINTTEKILTQVHLIEVIGNLVPITLDDAIRLHTCWSIAWNWFSIESD